MVDKVKNQMKTIKRGLEVLGNSTLNNESSDGSAISTSDMCQVFPMTGSGHRFHTGEWHDIAEAVLATIHKRKPSAWAPAGATSSNVNYQSSKI